jgi:hypothetical protein
LRDLRLFFCAAPRTPLRVLAIIALDTLHVLRHSQPLPRRRIGELAMLLDFQACANAAWDGKDLCEAEYHAIRQRLEQTGLGERVEEYLNRLRELESQRPSTGGDHRRFDEVRSYREAVARMSFATAIAFAFDVDGLEDGTRLIHCDGDLQTLFQIVMQCQVIDDVVDFREDRSASLPSFLTACASLPQSIELTVKAVRHYATSRARPSDAAVCPLSIALQVVTAVTTLVLFIYGMTYSRHLQDPLQC